MINLQSSEFDIKFSWHCIESQNSKDIKRILPGYVLKWQKTSEISQSMHCQAMQLRHEKKKSHREIAKILKLPVSTVGHNYKP